MFQIINPFASSIPNRCYSLKFIKVGYQTTLPQKCMGDVLFFIKDERLFAMNY